MCKPKICPNSTWGIVKLKSLKFIVPAPIPPLPAMDVPDNNPNPGATSTTLGISDDDVTSVEPHVSTGGATTTAAPEGTEMTRETEEIESAGAEHPEGSEES